MTAPVPQPTDFSQFTDDQLAMLLNVGGQARWLAMDELARRYPLSPSPSPSPPSEPTPPPV